MNRLLNYFIKPLSESIVPKIDFIGEDDLNFLREIGEYMYNKRQDKKEALNSLNYGIKTAGRRSELFYEIKKSSQDRLSDHKSIYSEVDVSNYNQDDIGDLMEISSNWMSPIISATVDSKLIEDDATAIGECPFEADRALLFMPVLEKWLDSYITEQKHSLAIMEFLHSVKDAIQMDKGKQEIIAKHDPSIQGKIIYTK